MHPNIETNPGTHSSPAVLYSAVRGQTGSSYREANSVCFQCCIIDFFFFKYLVQLKTQEKV